MNVKYYNMTSVSEQYSALTIDITASLTKAEKKADGIFITPRVIIKKLFDEIALFIDKTQLIKPYKILEPSCGTCEIVNYCDEQFSKPDIHAIEKNSKLFTGISGLKFKPLVKWPDKPENEFTKIKANTQCHRFAHNPSFIIG